MSYLKRTMNRESEEYDVVGIGQPAAKCVSKQSVQMPGFEEKKEVIALKVPGHQVQIGAFSDMVSYSPTQFQIYLVEEIERWDNGEIKGIVATELISFPVREKPSE